MALSDGQRDQPRSIEFYSQKISDSHVLAHQARSTFFQVTRDSDTCLDDAGLGRQTFRQVVTGSTPGRGVIIPQLSLPSLRGK